MLLTAEKIQRKRCGGCRLSPRKYWMILYITWMIPYRYCAVDTKQKLKAQMWLCFTTLLNSLPQNGSFFQLSTWTITYSWHFNTNIQKSPASSIFLNIMILLVYASRCTTTTLSVGVQATCCTTSPHQYSERTWSLFLKLQMFLGRWHFCVWWAAAMHLDKLTWPSVARVVMNKKELREWKRNFWRLFKVWITVPSLFMASLPSGLFW